MTDPIKLLRTAWALTRCPKCEDGRQNGRKCRSCFARGHASLRVFSEETLGRNPRVVARMLASKSTIGPQLVKRLQSLIDAKHHAMTDAAKRNQVPSCAVHIDRVRS